MVVSAVKATKYEFSVEAITQVSNRLEKAIKFGSHAMDALPIEFSLSPIGQMYEYQASDHEVGVGFEMDVIGGVGASFDEEYKDIKTPAAWANVALTYDQIRRAQGSAYNLAARLADTVKILQRRINLIAYVGDTKHSINGLGSATPFEAPDTGFDVTSVATIATTVATGKGQIDSDLSYDEFYTNAPLIIMGTPDVTENLFDALSTNQDFNGLHFVNQALRDITGNSASRYIENPYLAATLTVNDAGVGSITAGSDAMAMYYQHPDLVRGLASNLEIRRSPLDPTKGQVFQPVMRYTRLDLKSGAASGAGLIDTDVTGV